MGANQRWSRLQKPLRCGQESISSRMICLYVTRREHNTHIVAESPPVRATITMCCLLSGSCYAAPYPKAFDRKSTPVMADLLKYDANKTTDEAAERGATANPEYHNPVMTTTTAILRCVECGQVGYDHYY